MESTDMLNTVNGWLTIIGDRLGSSIQLDDTGACGLAFQDSLDIDISLDAVNGVVHLSSIVLSFPDDPVDLHGTLFHAMHLNNGLTESRSGCLALTPDEDGVMYCQACRVAEYDVASFTQTLETFLGARALLGEELENPPASLFAAKSPREARK